MCSEHWRPKHRLAVYSDAGQLIFLGSDYLPEKLPAHSTISVGNKGWQVLEATPVRKRETRTVRVTQPHNSRFV